MCLLWSKFYLLYDSFVTSPNLDEIKYKFDWESDSINEGDAKYDLMISEGEDKDDDHSQS